MNSIYKVYDTINDIYIALFAEEDEAVSYVDEHGGDNLQIHLFIDGVFMSSTNN